MQGSGVSDKETLKIGEGRPGPGRPAGLQNKLTRSVKDAFGEAFSALQEDPEVKLEVWGRANPREFYQLASKLIPTEINAKISGLREILSELNTPKS